MLDRLPIMEYLARTSVDVCGFFIPARSLEDTLKKYCKQLFILTGNNNYPYRLLGSASALKIGSQHLLFCCGHQISDCEPDTVSILHFATNTTITASRMIWPNVTDENRDTDWIDVRGLQYRVDDYKIPNLTNDFFRIVPNKNVWPANAKIGQHHTFILFGYPTEQQIVDYEIPHIHSTAVCTTAEYDGPSQSPHIHRLRMTRKDTFDSDGLSGGPVFYLGSTGAGEYFAGFAGMIVRGGQKSDLIHFVETSFLHKLFDFKP
jgi:hypothetical protein